MFKSKWVYVLITVGTCLAMTAHAGTVMGNGGATEVTQWANNLQLSEGVAQQIKIVAQGVQAYKTQLDQFQAQLKAGFKLDPSSGFGSAQSLQSEISAANKYLSSLDTAGASVSALKNDLNARSVEAKLKGMTMKEYIDSEGLKVQRGDARARQRLDTEAQLTQQVTEDFRVSERLSEKITDTDTNQSIQLLNLHMNRIIQQNARMTQIMANATGTEQADRMKKETDAIAGRNKALSDADQAHRASVQSQLDEINAAMAKYPSK